MPKRAPVTDQQVQAEFAADPEADIVAADRPGGRESDDGDDGAFPAVARQNGRAHQNGLAGHGNAGALERDERENGPGSVLNQQRMEM